MACKSPAQTRPWSISCVLAFVSLCAPSCLPASPRCPRLSTTSCPSRVLSPTSWETSGSSLARGTELFLPAQQSHLRARVLTVFLVRCQPIFQDGVSSETPVTVPHTIAQEVSSDSVSFGNVSRSTPPRFAAKPCTTGARSPQAPWTRSHFVACLSQPFPLVSPVSLQSSNSCIAASPSATGTVLFRPHAGRHWMVILTGASAGPFSVTAAASIAPDSSSQRATTSMSSANPRNAWSKLAVS